MSQELKRVLLVNCMFWIIAALLHPLSRLLPTESGDPPKIFSLLIPMVFLMLAVASTAMIKKAFSERIDK